MTSMAGPTTNKFTRTPRGFSVYVLGGSKDGRAPDGGNDQPRKLMKPRSHDREPRSYVDDTSTMPSYPAAGSYPFPAPGSTYGNPTFPSSASYNYSYGTPGHTPYGAPYPPADESHVARPSLRRGDPYDEVFESDYSGDEVDPYMYETADYARARRPSLSRGDSSHSSGMTARASTRRSSDAWESQYAAQLPQSRPVPVRGDSGSSRGEHMAGSRSSTLMHRLSGGYDHDYQYPDREYNSSPMSFGSSPGSPGSLASTDSDFSAPRTPPQLAPIQIPIGTPGSRSVRWDENLVAPSPIFASRRKGWFCRRGDQLWTNGGAYRPPKQAEEYPADLADYPDFGEGWMNEEGVRIDMQHCLVPKMPTRSALKRRES